jgi:hypothetical protein
MEEYGKGWGGDHRKVDCNEWELAEKRQELIGMQDVWGGNEDLGAAHPVNEQREVKAKQIKTWMEGIRQWKPEIMAVLWPQSEGRGDRVIWKWVKKSMKNLSRPKAAARRRMERDRREGEEGGRDGGEGDQARAEEGSDDGRGASDGDGEEGGDLQEVGRFQVTYARGRAYGIDFAGHETDSLVLIGFKKVGWRRKEEAAVMLRWAIGTRFEESRLLQIKRGIEEVETTVWLVARAYPEITVEGEGGGAVEVTGVWVGRRRGWRGGEEGEEEELGEPALEQTLEGYHFAVGGEEAFRVFKPVAHDVCYVKMDAVFKVEMTPGTTFAVRTDRKWPWGLALILSKVGRYSVTVTLGKGKEKARTQMKLGPGMNEVECGWQPEQCDWPAFEVRVSRSNATDVTLMGKFGPAFRE